MTPEVAIGELATLLERSERVLVFTGAGISTGSGIPDFRGPKGVWQTRTPTYLQDFMASDRARREYWEFKLESFRVFRDARPNRTHESIVALERAGRLECVVTQNVDGLHQAAGTARDKLVELHGTNSEVECVRCAVRETPDRAMADFERTREPPRCKACEGLMKPAVVMFGQALDPKQLERAREASEAADLILALGSSLVVTPAADIPLFGVRRGTPYVIVNQGETPHDGLASLRLDCDVGDVLPGAVARAGAGLGERAK
jgi:NAD-dependent deacetylase